ncbi:MAG: hypothetical protein KME10_19315 [Plectolyngbya sp. WJT66-NPBG17]|jgi:hypothetical protein|nr:hypothetical protein [Plectolyngbya sp. WJT66-NPBG17]MBW4527894.1 hypothetical protein [Phormidium tanganyikae FI6-MK23]
MLKLKARFFLPVIIAATCVTIAAPDSAQANCAGFVRPPEIVNPEVKQRAIQLKTDPNQFFGKKMLDTIADRRITLTPAFDRLTGLEKQQVLNTLQLGGSTVEVYAANGRLVSAQYDGCTRKYLLTERDLYSWYVNRPPIQAPLPMLRDALRNAGEPSWRKINQSIHPEDERRARFKFWQTVGYDKAKLGWWIAWVPEGGYFEVNVRTADDVSKLKPYFETAYRQHRYVVVLTDGTPSYDTQRELVNPWIFLLGKTSVPAGWSVSPCDSQSPFLCVFRNKSYIGSIAIQRLEYANHPQLIAEFNKLGLTPGLFTYSNPNDTAKVLTALKAIVADYYEVIINDRVTTYGKAYKVQVQPPEAIKVGSIPGLKYGFQGIDQAGQVREQYVSYMAFDGKLNIIVTGYDPAAETNVLRDHASLKQFEPYLKTIVGNLKLPENNPPEDSNSTNR